MVETSAKGEQMPRDEGKSGRVQMGLGPVVVTLSEPALAVDHPLS